MIEQMEETRLTMGQFGRLSQLSDNALRVYEDKGLLVPVHIDPVTDYRCYVRSQVVVARRIWLLRMLTMPLDDIVMVLAAWDADAAMAERLIQEWVTAVEKQGTAVQLAARLLQEEFSADKEREVSFTFAEADYPAQMVVSIRRNIKVPAYHRLIPTILHQLWDHIKVHDAQIAGVPLALYYGPINKEDDGPVEICVPFSGLVSSAGEVHVREMPAHKTIQVRTFGKYSRYPNLLEMWDAIGKYVYEQNLEPNWDFDMTTYEIWHEDGTMTICWPIREFSRVPA